MSEIKAMVADMLDLRFADDSFDVVIEKGTMVRTTFLVWTSFFFFRKCNLAFNLPSLNKLVIQGCIVRGQW